MAAIYLKYKIQVKSVNNIKVEKKHEELKKKSPAATRI